MTRPSGKIYTLSLFPAIDTTLYLEGMETVRAMPPNSLCACCTATSRHVSLPPRYTVASTAANNARL